MKKNLEVKLHALRTDPTSKCFILADAKDADMAFGIAAPGRSRDGHLRSLAEYRDQIRQIVAQKLVDIVLMSASTSELLTIRERIFDASSVTPAVRANDATDVHVVRGSCYTSAFSQPFASATLDHIQAGKHPCLDSERAMGANLGLYSVTFNNHPEHDLRIMEAYKAFRLEAEEKGFSHFLEVFPPNVPEKLHRLSPEQIPRFVNDHIVRLLAGVPTSSRPLFLKIPYAGPRAMEELCSYDPSLVVGVLGGSSGTTHDAFSLLCEAKRYGARIALFGRKINAAEDQLLFVQYLRLVADGEVSPVEAVKAYHGDLLKKGTAPYRDLNKDLELTSGVAAYGGSNT